MQSAALSTDGKNATGVFVDAELVSLRRGLKRAWVAVGVLLVLTLFSVATCVWLSTEVSKNDDDGGAEGLRLAASADRSADAQSLFAGSGYWTEKESLPQGRSDHHVVAVDDFIYIVGGLNATDGVLDDVTVYDTVLGIYTSGPSLPVPLHRFGCAYDWANGQIYVFGGLNEVDGEQLDTVYVLDVTDGEWREGPAMPTARSDLCGAYVEGVVYAIGGYSLGYAETLSTVEALSIADGAWKTAEALPTPRGDCKAAPIGGKVVVVGGYYDPAGAWSSEAFRSEVEVYTAESGAWEEKAPLPNPRGDKAVAVLPNERLLVVGGETHNRGRHSEVATHHVEEYSLSEDVWIDRAPLPTAVFRTGAAYVEGMVFVFGGHRTCEQEEDGSSCSESDVLQVYFDVLHPSVFID